MRTDLPMLTSARVVARSCLADGELPHVVYRLNELLDDFSADCTIAEAYKRTGSVRLMKYLAAREDPDEINTFYRRWLFNTVTEMAALRGDLESLQWLMEIYLPDEFSPKVVATAAANGHLNLLRWLYEKYRDRGYWNHTEMCGALTNGHVEVIKWLQTHAVPRPECMSKVMDAAARLVERYEQLPVGNESVDLGTTSPGLTMDQLGPTGKGRCT
ncbi:hypothetical protein GN244_ATG00654 [Phytophthora infestans]|uniref:Uncharacterized protein n=1 Tax=Phytophthora infestans TaxID=4787 RepID=A0A833WP50_PHYIN|nr:hypothetical protein GN244_ATG00654 [Phytophthora infestans]